MNNQALAMSAQLPSVTDELNRKTLETLEWLAMSLKNGQLSEPQVVASVNSVFMAVSGLVNEDCMDLFTSFSDEGQAVKESIRRHFHHPTADEVLTASWTVGNDTVSVIKRVGGVAAESKRFACTNAAAAAETVRVFATRLINNGWHEL